MIIQRYPNSSSDVSTLEPISSPVPFSTSSISATIERKSLVPSGWKTIAARPRVLMSCWVSRSTYAVVTANRRSGAGPLTLRRPSSASRRPTRRPLPPRALELALEPLQAGDPLLHRRVGREQVEQRLLRLPREDVEGVHLGVRAQVALRDALHRPADLQERRRERARAAGDDGRPAVGRELAVARQGHHQEERDDVDGHRDQQHDEEAGA